ncbi:nucleoside hydrolase [Cryobacterium glucosi]|uniref:Nucleoside hydrolase n=1 Tax=Cryobacterium glucosi TaxID=1259175 RepID=A0ABY2ITR4_9MICO|nr:nucleoside hydrolase [Cryobacterium glucosi]TFC22990.1 nucleoside hydrolase [Cryobacterium glucosi]
MNQIETDAGALPPIEAELQRVVRPRARVIIDNDFSGDPDGLVQLADHVLSPSVEIRAIIGSHLRPGDPFDPSEQTATNAAAAAAEKVLDLLGRTGSIPVIAGSNVGLSDRTTAIRSDATDLIIREVLRDNTELPLFVACGAGLTEIASAYLLEPRIADRLTLVWIGGPEHDGIAAAPPGTSGAEYNLAIDIRAAQVIFDSRIPLWQVPRDAYRQTLFSWAELLTSVRPCGAIGRHLYAALAGVADTAGRHGINLGETYILGDSPLVLLTALHSSFEPDPSSSAWVTCTAPRILTDGSYDPTPRQGPRQIRVYTRLDLRLLFADFTAKLAAHAAARE